MAAPDPTVSTGDIARLGRVGRAAVSNWRRRHDDFPAPIAGTASNPRFALAEVEDWLRRNGKQYRLSIADRAWQRLHAGGEDLLVPARLAAVGAYMLARTDPKAARSLPGAGELADPELERLLDKLAISSGPADVFEDLYARYRRRPGEPSDQLAAAMAGIALPDGGSVLDPACGAGGLLLAARTSDAYGQEVDPIAARIAAARLLLVGGASNGPGPVAVGDALRADAFPGRTFGAVLCAPPVADRTWPHTELAGDPRFVHGLPPRTEPELAWVQHALAHLDVGGRAVLRLPGAVASRRPGRRVRANLLRVGALRAVLTIEDEAESRPVDLWVLCRPATDDPPPTVVLLGRTDADGAAEMWESFVDGDVAGRARAVPVVDLLDDDVDLAPERHLPRRTSADAGRAFTELRGRDLDGLPALRVTDEAADRPDSTIAELARAGLLSVRHAPRDAASAGPGDVPVLVVADLAHGTVPSGRTRPGPGLVRVRPGDVVGAAMGRARVADRPAVLGPGLTVYRTDPDQLDPEYLAGVLRSTPAPASGGSSRYGQRVRVPLLPIAEQRAYGAAFRGLLAAADATREAADRAEALLRLGGEGLVEGWLRPE